MANKLFSFFIIGFIAIALAPFVWAFLIALMGFIISILEGLISVGIICLVGAGVCYAAAWIDDNFPSSLSENQS